MSLFGGKRKVNKGLKDWVTFVKKVQKEEKISYKDAIHRAKERKDKGEKWMSGGGYSTTSSSSSYELEPVFDTNLNGGKKRRTMRKLKNTRSKTASRARGRASRRH